MEKYLDLIKGSGLFDTKWYLENYNISIDQGMTPLEHYLEKGWKESKQPSSLFDANDYLRRYKDVAKSNINPLVHYILYGRKEGRIYLSIEDSIGLLDKNELFNFDEYLTTKQQEMEDKFSLQNVFSDFSKKALQFFIKSKNKTRKLQKITKIDKNECNLDVQQKYIDIDDIETVETNTNKEPIAVHLHLYYVDLSDEMISYLSNIPYKFDLFISVSKFEHIDSTYQKFKHSLPNVDKCIVDNIPNVGRDIYPFVVHFAPALLKYRYFCHIQTKQSLSSTSFTKLFFWRQYLLDSILGSADRVKRIFSLLDQENVGMVFPETFYSLSNSNVSISWWRKFPDVHYLLKRVGVSLPTTNIDFPAGTMFWCNIKCISSILKAQFDRSDFPKEVGVLNDGSTAHAFERLMGIVPVVKGFKNIIIKSPQNKLFNTNKLEDAKKKVMVESFSEEWYREAYPDVIEANIDPLYHYQNFGFNEGRIHLAYYPDNIINEILSRDNENNDIGLDKRYYLKVYQDVVNASLFGGISILKHYSNIGFKAGFTKNDNLRQEVIKSEIINEKSFAIIIPVYNSEKYLYNCLNSAYNQTVKNLHVIIVNDGSPDQSYKIIEDYRQKYPNITTVINHDVNLGLVATHQEAIATVNEDYFTILDGDDWLDLNFCEDLYYIAEAYHVDCVCCNWTRPSQYSKPRNIHQLPIDLRILDGDNIINSICKWNSFPSIHYGLNRKLYLTKSWKKINPSYPSDKGMILFEDAVLTNNYFTKCSKVACIRNFYYNWFYNTESVSNLDFSEKFINNSFDAMNDIYYLNESENKVLKDLFVLNVENSIVTELLTRLNKLFNKAKLKTKERIEFFASKYDSNLHLFNEKQKHKIETFIMEKYYSIVSERTKVKDFVLLLDPIGLRNIEKYFLDYFRLNTNYNCSYINLNRQDSLVQRLKYMIIGCEARVVITSGGWAISQFHTNRPIIQLWHGLGALKKVSPFPATLRPVLGICSSKNVVDVYLNLYNIPSFLVKPFGSIVTDELISSIRLNNARNEIFNEFPQLKGKKIYLWCPTFRGSANDLYIRDVIDFNKLSKCLSDDEIFMYKLHPAATNLNDFEVNYSEIDNIINATDCDLLKLLSVASVVMTDYSSILHYAMLLRIPVSFLITDYLSYSANPGLLIKKNDFPGPICENIEPSCIVQTIHSALNFDKTKYNRFAAKHCGACKDGKSRERIFSAVVNCIETL